MTCNAQHTTYDPPDDLFRCPHCGAFQGQFYIEEPDHEAQEGCERLHVCDELRCHSCGYGTTGSGFALELVAKLNPSLKPGFKTCPCCNGKGVVKEEQHGHRVETASRAGLRR